MAKRQSDDRTTRTEAARRRCLLAGVAIWLGGRGILLSGGACAVHHPVVTMGTTRVRQNVPTLKCDSPDGGWPAQDEAVLRGWILSDCDAVEAVSAEIELPAESKKRWDRFPVHIQAGQRAEFETRPGFPPPKSYPAEVVLTIDGKCTTGAPFHAASRCGLE